MEYKQIDLNSYKLHIVKTDKFKSILFKVIFRDEIKKDDITIRNLLIDNLIASTLKYPTRKHLSIKKQDLYGADVYGFNKRVGNHLLTELSMSILNPKYTEDKMLEESLSFFHDIIFEPNVIDDKFNEEIFNIIKTNMEVDIKSINDQPNTYAITKLKESIDKNKAFSYRMLGYLDDLNEITPASLYDYYLKFLRTNNIDFYIIGDVDFYDIEKIIREKFNFKTIKKDKCPLEIEYNPNKRKNKQIVEISKFNQSILAIGCYFDKLLDKEKNYVLTLYNIILGNSPESKFFKNIREKNSLAYTISSSFKKTDNLMLIMAGISSINYKKTLELINKEMKSMTKGDFSDSELDNAKELFISVLNDIYEYPDSILDYYFSLEYLGTEPVDIQTKQIRSITKEDIICLSKKVHFDTIYLLEEKHEKGVNNDENNSNK